MRTKGLLLGCMAIAVMLSSAATVMADDTAQLKAQLEALQSRIEKMEQDQADTVHREEVTRMMRDILDDAKAQPAMPSWMKNLKFYGDLRLRYQYDNRSGGSERKDDNRARFRLRFGMKKTWWDKQMEVGFRLASDGTDGGDEYQANSANQTFGGGFNKKRIGIDLAYAKYMPNCVEGLTIMGGKVKNPVRTKTLVTWDGDINPEGFAVDYQMPFFGDFKPYVQAGYWIVGEDQVAGDGFAGGDTRRDPTVWTLSTGFDWKIAEDMKLFVGATWYKWQNYRYAPGNGADNSNLYGYPGVVGAPYNPYPNMENIELTAKFGWKMLDLPWQVWGTWVHNCEDTYNQNVLLGYNDNQGGVTDAGDYDRHIKDQSDAFAMGMKVGKNKKKGDWSAQVVYYYVEGNSVPWFTTDSDYGGPNAKGWKMGGKYNIDDFLTVGVTAFLFDAITTGQSDRSTDDHFTLQVDLAWKF
jgi:hypothetical protein